MSFLRNARIRTKILSVIVPLCLMGLGATAFMAARYKAADTSYSSFISVDNATAMDLARADRNMAAMAYGAYHALSYEPEDPFLPVVLTIYEKNKTELIERMDRVKKADPSQETQIDAITSRIKLIASLTDKAIQFAKRSRRSDANAALLTADEHILTASQDVSRFLEDYKARVSERQAEISAQTDRTIATSLLGLVIVFGLGIGIALLVATKGITRPIGDLRSRMASLAAGETDRPIAGQDRRDELGDMARAVAVFRDNASERTRLERETENAHTMTERERREREVQKAQDDAQKARDAADLKFAVDRLAIGLGQLAEGDMTCIIEDAFADQLDGLRTNFNDSVDNLRHALKAVGENADGVDRGARDVRTAVADLSRRTALQAASLEETAAALEELTVSMKDASVRAEEAGQLVARTRDGAVRSGEVVADAVTAMNEIERSATEITSIIGVIDEIAFQTNLLALNAAVEAARAGESGRGFAVVAQEVRELAQRSAAAARKIKDLITTCEKNVRSGASLVNATGASLETIVSEVQEVNRHFVAIVDCIREQTTGLNEINRSVNELDGSTQQNALMVEEQTVASDTLAGEAEALNQLISQFGLGELSITGDALRDETWDKRKATPNPADHLLLRPLRVA